MSTISSTSAWASAQDWHTKQKALNTQAVSDSADLSDSVGSAMVVAGQSYNTIVGQKALARVKAEVAAQKAKASASTSTIGVSAEATRKRLNSIVNGTRDMSRVGTGTPTSAADINKQISNIISGLPAVPKASKYTPEMAMARAAYGLDKLPKANMDLSA